MGILGSGEKVRIGNEGFTLLRMSELKQQLKMRLVLEVRKLDRQPPKILPPTTEHVQTTAVVRVPQTILQPTNNLPSYPPPRPTKVFHR